MPYWWTERNSDGEGFVSHKQTVDEVLAEAIETKRNDPEWYGEPTIHDFLVFELEAIFLESMNVSVCCLDGRDILEEFFEELGPDGFLQSNDLFDLCQDKKNGDELKKRLEETFRQWLKERGFTAFYQFGKQVWPA